MTVLHASSFIPASPPPITPARVSPLSGAQIGEFELAAKRSGKIRRAAAVAKMDAWLSAIFAGMTLISAIFNPWSLLLAAALGGIAFNSFRGAKRLLHFDPSAPELLARNQLALAGTLIVYAACCLWSASRSGPELLSAAGSSPEVANLLGGYHLNRLYRLLNLAIYGGLIAGTLVGQGLAALYYHTRKKHLLAYIASTPAWILEIQKAQITR